MPSTTFDIVTNDSPGCLERILRLTRHRGFDITFFCAEESSPDKGLHIALRVKGDRDTRNFCAQLNKLVDVAEAREVHVAALRSCLADE